ncbi:MAG: starch phosphorylase [Monoraphidium minutum]|nr:MAG: starch phosphorylase [Monoraphidium minutum]
MQVLRSSSVRPAHCGAQRRLSRALPARSSRPLRVQAVAAPERMAAKPAAPTEAEIRAKLKYLLGKIKNYDAQDLYRGTAWSVREKLIDAFENTQDYWASKDPKFVYYLSAEFLQGRSLLNAVLNLGIEGEYAQALKALGTTLEEAVEQENNAALGNGGLGRLAACFLDSIASLDLPGWGYGIRYKYGMFKQLIENGYQAEVPDIWLTNGNPWEIKRGDIRFPIGFGGKVELSADGAATWAPLGAGARGRAPRRAAAAVMAVAYDNPIPGWRTPTVTNLRLWDAEPLTEFDLNAFNAGERPWTRSARGAISAVLYPNDSTPEGKELRLKQQYFFVSASLQDVMARFKAVHGTKFSLLPEKAAFQLNDTHPTIAVAELMRILVDVEGLDWEEAWGITTKCVNYTNHTVMPEALEKWPVKVRGSTLLHAMNDELPLLRWIAFLGDKFSGLKPAEREALVERMSIIQENPWVKDEMQVNMAYLACVSSAAVNGVAAIHSEIVKQDIFNDFYKLFPEKFQNKTNGVTPRRWLAFCNPELAGLVTEKLGSDDWIKNTYELAGLRKFADDKDLHKKWRAVKQAKKQRLAAYIKSIYGTDVNTNAMFDIQVKRIHEYKRQLMNVLSVIWRYKQIKKMTPEQRKKVVPRMVAIGGKAASAYDMAKRIIHLVCKVGEKINTDPDTKDYLQLYFLPDYNVSLAEIIIPAAELSQHISTAGTEASGTSNMKFQMNGCLIIGTMDGANIEIAEESGKENMFVFGVDAEDVPRLRKERKNFKNDPRFEELMKDIEEGMFGDKDYFKPLVDSISNMKVGNDWFLVANDFADYLRAQEEVDKLYMDQEEWTRRSILYTAGSGKFSSDRTIVEYAKDIWHIEPCRPPAAQ